LCLIHCRSPTPSAIYFVYRADLRLGDPPGFETSTSPLSCVLNDCLFDNLMQKAFAGKEYIFCFILPDVATFSQDL